jgi:hypothetical protein
MSRDTNANRKRWPPTQSEIESLIEPE